MGRRRVMSPGAALWFILSEIWAIMLTLMAIATLFFAFTSMDTVAGVGIVVGMLVVGWFPFLVPLNYRKMRAAPFRKVFQEYVGVTSTGLFHADGTTGIAINDSRTALFLGSSNTLKKYSLSDVRDWQDQSNGLFCVRVKDLDNAAWHIVMSDPKTASRWVEILQQTVNER